MKRILSALLFFLVFTGSVIGQDSTFAEKQVACLQKVLERYMNLEGLSDFFCDSCLKRGDSSRVILSLRRNLALLEDLEPEANTGTEVFDDTLEKALIKFQKRHGLEPDGILGPKTIAALNIPLTFRTEQIRESLEQWKAFSVKMPEPYILVNIPDFSLYIIDSGKVVRSMKVIVGRLTDQTPLISGKITYIVLNPWWTVPRSIAVKEIIPVVKKDPEYLRRNHMEVYASLKGFTFTVNPDTINWNRFGKNGLNYQIVQKPGKWNALGQIKFMFANEYSVYLHDTPEKHLFSHTLRIYSHGCVRLEDPLGLASWLLGKDREEISQLIRKKRENTVVMVPDAVPITIDYFTCWVDPEGRVQFREDVYGLGYGLQP